MELGGPDVACREAPVYRSVAFPNGALQLQEQERAIAPPLRPEDNPLWELRSQATWEYLCRIGCLDSSTVYFSFPGLPNRRHQVMQRTDEILVRSHPHTLLDVGLIGGTMLPLKIRAVFLEQPQADEVLELRGWLRRWHEWTRAGVGSDPPPGDMAPIAHKGRLVETDVDWRKAGQDTINFLVVVLHEFDLTVAPLRALLIGPDGGRIATRDHAVAATGDIRARGLTLEFALEAEEGPAARPSVFTRY